MQIREIYPDYLKYRAYHQLVGSSPSKDINEDIIDGDFEGDDSVEKFFKSMI